MKRIAANAMFFVILLGILAPTLLEGVNFEVIPDEILWIIFGGITATYILFTRVALKRWATMQEFWMTLVLLCGGIVIFMAISDLEFSFYSYLAWMVAGLYCGAVTFHWIKHPKVNGNLVVLY